MHRRVLAEVALEADRPNARVARVQALERGERAVGGAVVDEHELERPAVDGGDGALVELLDRPFLVQQRHDDRELGLAVH